jgi:periplasmic divalent cation tolerance protein
MEMNTPDFRTGSGIAFATEVRIVLTTAASREEAAALGQALVEERLAACATVIPGAESIFHWQGKVERSSEAVVLLKTEERLLGALETRLHALHSYETPEFLVLPVIGGSKGYLAWLSSSLSGP